MLIRSIDPVLSWLQRLVLLAVSFVLLWVCVPQLSEAEELPNVDRSSSSEVQSVVPNHSGLDANAISTEKISQFIQAYLSVVGLIEQRESDLQSAETESESMQMQQAIRTEAVELIQDKGLTLQEYLQLLNLANVDPEFGERVTAQLQESMQ
ncbi:DUF4168 domain-containing protein [Egbenema bharatensis]|uniref:DUF4168 domain-containing protein n=1 Tax=Egbenema bharatensis TaxID=3463334 RepID=UPI003A8BDF27